MHCVVLCRYHNTTQHNNDSNEEMTTTTFSQYLNMSLSHSKHYHLLSYLTAHAPTLSITNHYTLCYTLCYILHYTQHCTQQRTKPEGWSAILQAANVGGERKLALMLDEIARDVDRNSASQGGKLSAQQLQLVRVVWCGVPMMTMMAMMS